MDIGATLKSLDISLPPVSTPAAVYLPFVQTGNLVFLSGHSAFGVAQIPMGACVEIEMIVEVE